MKTILLFLALIILICSTPGGYTTVQPSDLPNLSSNEIFASAQAKARQVFQQKHNANLGKIIAVKQQMVAGVNYKITFQSPQGQFDVVVFTQPWTNTIKVLDIKKI